MNPPPPRRWAAVAFSLVLLSPLAALPGSGAWGERLLLLAAAAAALAFDRARRPAGGVDALGVAAFALLAVHGLALLGAPSPGEGLPALVLLLAGLLVFFQARSGGLTADFLGSAVPVLLSGAGIAFSAVGLVQALWGVEAISTLGNRNYSGTLAALLLPVAVASGIRPANPRLRALHAAAAAALFVYLVVTDSRAGILAAAAGTALAVAVVLRDRPRRAAGAAAGAALLLLLAPFAARGLRPVSAGRLETMTVRLRIWEGALQMIVDRPFLGLGPGNFAVAYPPYRSMEEARMSHAHAHRGFREVEDAHSSWVQAVAETGVPGLLAWVAVVAFGARSWRRALRGTAPPAILAGLGGGALAFVIGGFFNTLTLQPAHAALFWAFLGMIEAGTPRPAAAGKAAAVLGWAGLALAFPAMAVAYRTAFAERSFRSAMATTDPAARLASLEASLAFDPRSWRAHEAKASLFLETGRPAEAASAADEALKVRPHGALALNYAAIARLRLGSPAAAEAFFRRALQQAPHCWVTHLNVGVFEFERGQYGQAEWHYSAAEFIAWNLPHLPYRRAETFLIRDDLLGALPALRRARDLGYPVVEAIRRDYPAKAGDRRLAEFFP